jgi:hypothetical protein
VNEGRQAEIFLRQAEYCETRSPLYAELCRRFADDRRVGELAPDLRWDFPLRLLGGLHYLVLAAHASWDGVDDALEDHADFLARFTAEQDVQTNEVRRAWALLPGLLSAGAPRIDLLELGASAGLLLEFDRYGYRYRAGSWGDGALVLDGDDRGGPPAELLARRLSVGRRRGVDLNPVDVTSDHGARLLQAFVWPDQVDRMERLRAAIELVRDEPPELVRGDYVELLPRLLEERRDDALTVVFDSVSTVYLDEERYQELVVALAQAGRDGPLAWLSLEGPRDDREYGATALELTVWPGGRTRRLAKVDFHCAWLEWFAL